MLALFVVLGMTKGEFVYALDDAYIHLAVARSLFQHQLWGVDGIAFAPASSSILWPLLLLVSGGGSAAGHLVPFILNLIFSILCIWLAHRLMPNEALSSRARFVALSLFILVAPLGLLAYTGMEHTLQIFLTLVVAVQAALMLSEDRFAARDTALLAVLCLALAATRYEGLFIVAPICGLFFLSGRLVAGLLVGLSAWTPIVLFGLYSKAHGWFFFPTSVLLKTAQSFHAASEASQSWAAFPILKQLKTVALKFSQQFGVTPSLLFFTVAICIFYVSRRKSGVRWNDFDQVLGILYLGAVALHMSLGSVDGPAYRYEAYVVALGFIVLLRQWVLVRGLYAQLDLYIYQPWRIALCFLFLAGPRMIVSNLGLPFGPRGIYEQQIQIAKFLEQNFSGTTIAANDVGAVNYRGSVRTLDLFGLTTFPVAKLKLEGAFDTAAIASLAAKSQAKLAVVYENWFVQYGGLPSDWVKVGEWSVPFTLVCGQSRISFFAIGPAEQEHAREALRKFNEDLPAWVTGNLT